MRKSSSDARSPTADLQNLGQENSAANSAAAGSPAPNIADDFVEFAASYSAVAPACTNADSMKSYAHGAACHPPSQLNTPRRRPQNHLPRHASRQRSRLVLRTRCPLFAALSKPPLPTSRVLTHSTCGPHGRWRTALAAGQRLGSRAPAARKREDARRASTSHGRGTRSHSSKSLGACKCCGAQGAGRVQRFPGLPRAIKHHSCIWCMAMNAFCRRTMRAAAGAAAYA